MGQGVIIFHQDRNFPLIFGLLFFWLLVLTPAQTALSCNIPATCGEEVREAQVKWIHDGDTIEVAGFGPVRLLGIDAPEQESSARDAFYTRQGIAPATLRRVHREGKDFLIKQIKGQTVTLEYESEQRDRYGRLLAYVFLPDGRLLNLILIENGYAAVYRRFDFRRKKDFLAAEARARKAERGIWKKWSEQTLEGR